LTSKRVSVPPRVAIYVSGDSQLRDNQQAAMQRYADAMGWVTAVVIETDMRRLLDGAAEHTFDLVLCWRHDLPSAESLVERLSVHDIELLALAQSCTALLE
jgi:hypothetical protein